MVLMIAFLGGFLESFVDSIRLLFGPYAPVLPLGIVWPWDLPLHITHKVLWQHLQEEFVAVGDLNLPAGFLVLRRRID